MLNIAAAEAPDWFQAALAHEAAEELIEVRGCEIAFRRWGRGTDPGVLLVHGGGGQSRWWDHIAPFLASDCAVAALDLSGHGDSGRRERYTWELWGEEILAVASTLTLAAASPVVIAHSMGARASVKAAAMGGDRLRALVLVDSSVGVEWPAKQRLASRASSPRFYSSREEILERFRLRPAQQRTLPYVVDHIARTSIRATDDGWTWKMDPNTRDRDGDIGPGALLEVPCELALVRGEHGRVAPNARWQLRELLGRPVPVVEIPGAAHHIMVDEPLSLVTALRGCLASWDHGAIRDRLSAPAPQDLRI